MVGGVEDDKGLASSSARRFQDLLNQYLEEIKTLEGTDKSNAEAVNVNANSIKSSERKIGENAKEVRSLKSEMVDTK